MLSFLISERIREIYRNKALCQEFLGYCDSDIGFQTPVLRHQTPLSNWDKGYCSKRRGAVFFRPHQSGDIRIRCWYRPELISDHFALFTAHFTLTKFRYCKPAPKALLLTGHRWVSLFLMR